MNTLRYWNGQSWTEDRWGDGRHMKMPRRLKWRWVILGFGVSLIAWIPAIGLFQERGLLLGSVPLWVALVLALIPRTRPVGLALAIGATTWWVAIFTVIPIAALILVGVLGGA